MTVSQTSIKLEGMASRQSQRKSQTLTYDRHLPVNFHSLIMKNGSYQNQTSIYRVGLKNKLVLPRTLSFT